MNRFNDEAERYDAWFDEHLEIFQAELAVIRNLLPKQGKGVEVGVGTGRFASALGIGLGVEPAENMASRARSRGLTVVPGTAETLPLPDESFDYALLVTVLCFVQSVPRALQEVARILKPHGVVVIGFIEKSSPLARRTVAIANEDSLFRGARFPQMDELQKQLRESGFGAISCCQTLCDHLPDPLKTHKGYDGGNFVVIRATKGEPG